MLVIRNPRKSAKTLHGRIYCLIKFPRVAPIKHALRQKAWRYAPFAAKTSLYRRPPVSAYGCILFWIPEIRNPNSRNRIPPPKAGDHGNPRRNAPLFLWGLLPPLPSVAFSLARSAQSVEPPRSLQGFLPEICRNHIVCPPSVLSGSGCGFTYGHSIPYCFRPVNPIPLYFDILTHYTT